MRGLEVPDALGHHWGIVSKIGLSQDKYITLWQFWNEKLTQRVHRPYSGPSFRSPERAPVVPSCREAW